MLSVNSSLQTLSLKLRFGEAELRKLADSLADNQSLTDLSFEIQFSLPYGAIIEYFATRLTNNRTLLELRTKLFEFTKAQYLPALQNILDRNKREVAERRFKATKVATQEIIENLYIENYYQQVAGGSTPTHGNLSIPPLKPTKTIKKS